MTMRVLFAGTPVAAAKVLGVVSKQGPSYGYSVAGVLTRSDAPIGRKRVLTASPVADEAQKLHLPVIKSNRIDPTVLSGIAALNIDLAAVVAYGVLLPPDALAALPLGWINLHYSLLPAWRGAAPVQACLRAGENLTGTTIFRIDAGMDTGNILAQQQTAINPEETAGELLERLSGSGAIQLVRMLAKHAQAAVAGESLTGIPQEEIAERTNARISYAPKITGKDAQISWKDEGKTIVNLIRAMDPEPGAWSFVRVPKKDSLLRLKIMRAHLVPSEEVKTVLGIGEIRAEGSNVRVGGGGSDIVEIDQVQPEGKKVMTAAQWIRGLNGVGEQLTGIRMVSSQDKN